jgi:hypothetical protein
MQDKITLDIEIAPSGETKDVKRTSEYYEPEQESEIKTRY